jgi:hypothetical protein
VYGRVAAAVSEVVDRDAANGHDLAKRLQGKIGRKLVKQTVRLAVLYSTALMAALGYDDCLWSDIHRSEPHDRQAASRAKARRA